MGALACNKKWLFEKPTIKHLQACVSGLSCTPEFAVMARNTVRKSLMRWLFSF
jgi:hypothetical protein